MDAVALWLGWLLTWAFGVVALAALPRRRPADAPGESGFMMGAGFFAGQFLVTLWMRLLAAAGIPFGVVAIAVPMAAATAVCGWIAWHRKPAGLMTARQSMSRTLSGSALETPQRLLWLALLAWLMLRFALHLNEVLRRPLYPWDAWMEWATKARVWYALKTMVPFGSASAWINAPAGSVYYDAAPHVPATVPLVQVWSATLIGRWDDALINLPWWLTAVAFGLALYGFLRWSGFRELYALLGTWLVVSLPILDTHVALAGYADLAMSTYFTLTALAALRFVRTHAMRDLVLALLLGAACVVIKNPGKIWLAMLVPGLVATLLPRYGLRFAAACFAVAAIAALALTRIGVTVLGYRLQLDFHMPWNGLAQAYFAFANWHLLFYGALAVALLGWRQLWSKELAPLTLIVAAGFAFLMFGFAFTNARLWVEDQSTVNRATLHLAPLIVVWMLIVFRAWAAAQEPAIAANAEPPSMTDGEQSTAHRNRPDSSPVEEASPAWPVVGRNDPCPCGSGRRYKQCHGALEAAPSSRAPSIEAESGRAAMDPARLAEQGVVAHQRGNLDAAERAYRGALAGQPEQPLALHYLGVVLHQRGKDAEALPLVERSVALVPEEPEFHNNLGLVLAALDRNDEAIAAYRRALDRKPDHSTAWNNLGLALQAQNRLPEAIDAFRRAIALVPGFAHGHWNLALALLASGNYEEGWREYEWRLRLPELGANVPPLPVPRWQGEDLRGRTLLVSAEQGIGDAIQFVRFVALLGARDVRVVVQAAPELRALLATAAGVAATVSADEPLPPDCAAEIPLLSLPYRLGLHLGDAAAPRQYLRSDPSRTPDAARVLARARPATRRIGLAWAGSPRHRNDARRSMPLAMLAPLLCIRDITWLSLQKGPASDQLAQAPEAADVVPLDPECDFDHAAALVDALDAVVTVDTSIAHLAGALGKPTHVLLPFAPDWRWGIAGARTPWYSAMTLYRQPAIGDWSSAVESLREALVT